MCGDRINVRVGAKMSGDKIEVLMASEKWKAAQAAIEKELALDSDNHWLWTRLADAKYEQRDYAGALEDADRALRIVPDCPLALWSRAGALDMLGRTAEAGRIYCALWRRARQELSNPDEDAEECWEGKEWTQGLLADCMFRLAGGLVRIRERKLAADWYAAFLSLLDLGISGIYSRADAKKMLRKLGHSTIKKSDCNGFLPHCLSKTEKLLAAS